jgi:hypothetical protein
MRILNFFKKKKNNFEFEDWTKIVSKEYVDSFLNEIRKNPQATKTDIISQGYGEFGLEKSNPIPTFGIPSKTYYLERLRTSDDKIVRYRRTGSIKVENIYNPVDEYELFNTNGETIAFLYFSAYHFETSKKVPYGFHFAGKSNKKFDSSKNLIEVYNQTSHFAEFQRSIWKKLDENLKNRIQLKIKTNEFKSILYSHNIHTLYHFTDRSNLMSIKRNSGLFSWHYSNANNIVIPMPGGNQLSRDLDESKGLQNYVRLSFTKNHPMMFVEPIRQRDNVILEIDLDVIFWDSTLFSDRNANRKDAQIGDSIEDFSKIKFELFSNPNHFKLNEFEKPYYQAEILVFTKVPIECIRNINQLI